MKDQDKKSAKADKKNKKEKNGGKSPDKKSGKAMAKQLNKDLEKKLEKAVKQIRKETRKALREVLEQALDRVDQDTKRVLKQALAGSFPTSPDSYSNPDREDHDRSLGDAGVQEVTLDMEPDELHMGDEIPVVSVIDNDDDADEDLNGNPEKGSGKQKKEGKKSKEASAVDQGVKGGKTPPLNNPRKRGTAEAEIGSRTGAPASPMDDADGNQEA